MKHLLFLLLAPLAFAFPAEAFSPIVTEVSVPYQIVSIDEYADSRHDFLGELKDYPIMYEISVDEEADLQVQISQRFVSEAEPIPFSLIVVRKNDRGGGVKEVVRQKLSSEDWAVEKNSMLGMDFWQGPVLSESVQAGTYRIEISTPKNEGRYMLSFGSLDSVDIGFFDSLSSIRTTQKFFGHSFFRMFVSSYVYWPLGIAVLGFLAYRLWFYRKLFTHVD